MWSKALKPQQQSYSTFKRELMAIQLAMRYFNADFNGRHLTVFSDHQPIIGSMKSNDLQCHDPQAQNALNEISQWTSDVRHKSGKSIPVADWLSRPEGQPVPSAYDVIQDSELSSLSDAQNNDDTGMKPRGGVIHHGGQKPHGGVVGQAGPKPLGGVIQHGGQKPHGGVDYMEAKSLMEETTVKYVSPDETIAALENVALRSSIFADPCVR